MTTFNNGTIGEFVPKKPFPQGNIYGHNMVSLFGQQVVYVSFYEINCSSSTHQSLGGTNGAGQAFPFLYEYDVLNDNWVSELQILLLSFAGPANTPWWSLERSNQRGVIYD